MNQHTMNHVADAHKGFTYYSVSNCMLMLEVFSPVILLKLLLLPFCFTQTLHFAHMGKCFATSEERLGRQSICKHDR